jgi:hypothetical protein
MDLFFTTTRDRPLSLHHLPLEFKLEVIEFLYGVNVGLIMTFDTAWINPYAIPLPEGNPGEPFIVKDETKEQILATSLPKAMGWSPLKILRV